MHFPRTRLAFLALISARLLSAAAGGSISGIISDATGAAVPHAQLKLTNSGLKTEFRSMTDGKGFYSFPSLPVGRYDLRVEARGFGTQEKTNVSVDADAALRIDLRLEVGQRSESVTVTESDTAVETQVDMVETHLAARGISNSFSGSGA